eukprot:TRINITY_DN3888_c0_g1_i5.p1 TRINITY_DN3888_c0_g1~~TRINITY_DN3888_c0_g1_i5.p1  ORF type:complete len:301 (+),score=35.60 TRINITY_DN3888_c0_g1_i5:220-1122(+)
MPSPMKYPISIPDVDVVRDLMTIFGGVKGVHLSTSYQQSSFHKSATNSLCDRHPPQEGRQEACFALTPPKTSKIAFKRCKGCKNMVLLHRTLLCQTSVGLSREAKFESHKTPEGFAPRGEESPERNEGASFLIWALTSPSEISKAPTLGGLESLTIPLEKFLFSFFFALKTPLFQKGMSQGSKPLPRRGNPFGVSFARRAKNPPFQGGMSKETKPPLWYWIRQHEGRKVRYRITTFALSAYFHHIASGLGTWYQLRHYVSGGRGRCNEITKVASPSFFALTFRQQNDSGVSCSFRVKNPF